MLPRFVYWVSLFLAIISIIIRFSEIKNLLSLYFPCYDITSFIAITLSIITIVDFFVNKFSPIEELKKIKSGIWLKMDDISKDICSMLKVHGIDESSINILKTSWYLDFDTKNKYYFKKNRTFKQIWGYNSFQKFIQDLELQEKQGACGIAQKSGRLIFYDLVNYDNLDELNNKVFRFTPEQTLELNDLKLIISIPLIVKKNKYNKQSQKLVGILNFEARQIDDKLFLLDNKNRIQIINTLIALSNYYTNHTF